MSALPVKRALAIGLMLGFYSCQRPVYAVTVSLQQLAAASTVAVNVVPHVLHPVQFKHKLGAELRRLKRKKATK